MTENNQTNYRRITGDEPELKQLAETIENKLPELVGTEKQVNWANKIRKERVNLLVGYVDFLADRVGEMSKTAEDAEAACNNFLSGIKYAAKGLEVVNLASWWILYRDDNGKTIFIEMMKSGKEEEAEEAVEKTLDTIVPENAEKSGFVRITADTEKIYVEYMKDDDFRGIVKNLGYRWDAEGVKWYKTLDYSTGKTEDRIAELANKLLNCGFIVKLPIECKEKAVAADFEPMTNLWISKIGGEITIKIPYGDDDMYKQARRVHGAKWVRGKGVVVPAASYEEIRDFAEMNNYKISPGADEALVAAEKEYMKAITGNKTKVSRAKSEYVETSEDKLVQKLDNEGIIDDLRDED